MGAVEGLDLEAVGDFAGEAGVAGICRAEVEGRLAVVEAAGMEGGRHQGDGVVLAAVIERFALLPGAPDGTQGAHVVAEPRGDRRERRGVPLLDVHLGLGDQSKLEAAFGKLLQVPGGVGDDRRAAGEGDGGSRLELEAGGRGRRNGEGEEGVVVEVVGGVAVEAEGLGAAGLVGDASKVGGLLAKVDFEHGLYLGGCRAIGGDDDAAAHQIVDLPPVHLQEVSQDVAGVLAEQGGRGEGGGALAVDAPSGRAHGAGADLGVADAGDEAAVDEVFIGEQVVGV